MELAVALFLGFSIDTLFAREMQKIPASILNTYINEDSDYLQEIEDQGIRYLGKHVEKCAELSSLELLEVNIFSLLKKIVPDYPYHTTPLVILATHCDSHGK